MAAPHDDAVLRWAASGGMALTGHAHGPPLAPPADLLFAADAAAHALRTATASWGVPVDVDVDATLFQRAGLMRARRQGRTSVGRSCRLLRTLDGWAAVNLARPDDADSVAAIVGDTITAGPWAALEDAAARMTAKELADRAQLLGVPAASLGRPDGAPPVRVTMAGDTTGAGRQPLVVDLSSMWAGPLCAHLLGRAGARVVKVESTSRPDGARFGHPGFYASLHAGHDGVVLDFRSAAGRRTLHELLARADVVIESSRPRALAQLGVDAEQFVARRAGATWVRITGYARTGDAAQRVAFGDDAAVAGGLVAHDEAGGPVFCGDAIADPLAGLYAAASAAAAVAAGGGRLVDVALRDVAAHAAAGPPMPAHHTRAAADGGWVVRSAAGVQPVLPPRDEGAAAASSARRTRRSNLPISL